MSWAPGEAKMWRWVSKGYDAIEDGFHRGEIAPDVFAIMATGIHDINEKLGRLDRLWDSDPDSDPGMGDHLSPDEWLKRRNEQVYGSEQRAK